MSAEAKCLVTRICHNRFRKWGKVWYKNPLKTCSITFSCSCYALLFLSCFSCVLENHRCSMTHMRFYTTSYPFGRVILDWLIYSTLLYPHPVGGALSTAATFIFFRSESVCCSNSVYVFRTLNLDEEMLLYFIICTCLWAISLSKVEI